MSSHSSKSNSMTDRAGMDRLREKGGDFKQGFQEMSSAAQAAAQQKYEGLRDTVGTYVEQGRDRAIEFEESLESRIREKPISSVLMATGLGFLVGMMWMRK